jgi:DNA-binding CsgD family transcriptional regulator
MQPRDRLTAKEVQVATLVWQGLTNKDIAGVLRTSEQVVKNYLRTAFDKLGVWTRLELALYVAGHGGANWHLQLGNGLLPVEEGWRAAANEAPQLARSQDSGSHGSTSHDSRSQDSRSQSLLSGEKRFAGGALS